MTLKRKSSRAAKAAKWNSASSLQARRWMPRSRREGEMPLPPYIAGKRKPDARDATDYQTIFAAHEGSVAAPTAGLHFTPELFARLAAKGIARESVTLHVGAGTFLPVTADDTRDHNMHRRMGDARRARPRHALNRTRARRRAHRCGRHDIACARWKAPQMHEGTICTPSPARRASSSRPAIVSEPPTCC